MDVGDKVIDRAGRRYEILAKTEDGRPIVGNIRHGNIVESPFIAEEDELTYTGWKETS